MSQNEIPKRRPGRKVARTGPVVRFTTDVSVGVHGRARQAAHHYRMSIGQFYEEAAARLLADIEEEHGLSFGEPPVEPQLPPRQKNRGEKQ